jgi:hypothetical protein
MKITIECEWVESVSPMAHESFIKLMRGKMLLGHVYKYFGDDNWYCRATYFPEDDPRYGERVHESQKEAMEWVERSVGEFS